MIHAHVAVVKNIKSVVWGKIEVTIHKKTSRKMNLLGEPSMAKSRKLKIDKNYIPVPTHKRDEIYPNGIFHFNISRILSDIEEGILVAPIRTLKISEISRISF